MDKLFIVQNNISAEFCANLVRGVGFEPTQAYANGFLRIGLLGPSPLVAEHTWL